MQLSPTLRAWLVALAVAVVAVLGAAVMAVPAARADEAAPLVSQEVVVRKGDTLRAIAVRNGVKIADVRRWNRGKIGKNDVIKAGATLIVKVPADKADPARVPGANKPGDAKKPDGHKPDAKVARPANAWEDQVRVRRGDSLSKIAARVDVPMADLMAWNGLTERSKLKAGQVLVIYRPGPKPAPQSVGRPTVGSLAYGNWLGDGHGYRLRFPKNAYGVDGVLKTLKTCARRIKDNYAGTPDILIGDISRPGGGPFSPHESHQSGRDVDVGYYLVSNAQNETLFRVKPGDIDYAKTWAHLRCYLTSDKVVRVYIDRKIQVAMIEWMRKKKAVDEGQIQRLFAVEGGDEALVQHAKEHDTHMHVRFACDAAQPDCVEEAGDEPFDL